MHVKVEISGILVRQLDTVKIHANKNGETKDINNILNLDAEDIVVIILRI